HADAAFLLEDRHAEANAVGVFDGEVGAAFFLQFLLATIRRDAFHQSRGVIRVEHLGVELAHAAMMPHHRRLTHRDVEVAGLELDDGCQQLVDQNVTGSTCAYDGHGSTFVKGPRNTASGPLAGEDGINPLPHYPRGSAGRQNNYTFAIKIMRS